MRLFTEEDVRRRRPVGSDVERFHSTKHQGAHPYVRVKPGRLLKPSSGVEMTNKVGRYNGASAFFQTSASLPTHARAGVSTRRGPNDTIRSISRTLYRVGVNQRDTIPGGGSFARFARLLHAARRGRRPEEHIRGMTPSVETNFFCLV